MKPAARKRSTPQKESAPLPLCLQQIPHKQAWDQTPASAGGPIFLYNFYCAKSNQLHSGRQERYNDLIKPLQPTGYSPHSHNAFHGITARAKIPCATYSSHPIEVSRKDFLEATPFLARLKRRLQKFVQRLRRGSLSTCKSKDRLDGLFMKYTQVYIQLIAQLVFNAQACFGCKLQPSSGSYNC